MKIKIYLTYDKILNESTQKRCKRIKEQLQPKKGSVTSDSQSGANLNLNWRI